MFIVSRSTFSIDIAKRIFYTAVSEFGSSYVKRIVTSRLTLAVISTFSKMLTKEDAKIPTNVRIKIIEKQPQLTVSKAASPRVLRIG